VNEICKILTADQLLLRDKLLKVKKQTMTVQAKKYQIIEKITHIEDERLLDDLSLFLDAYESRGDAVLEALMKPMRETLDVEELKKEQNYQGFDAKEVDEIIEEADIQESLEKLLAMI
jgi:hypothetical protein